MKLGIRTYNACSNFRDKVKVMWWVYSYSEFNQIWFNEVWGKRARCYTLINWFKMSYFNVWLPSVFHCSFWLLVLRPAVSQWSQMYQRKLKTSLSRLGWSYLQILLGKKPGRAAEVNRPSWRHPREPRYRISLPKRCCSRRLYKEATVKETINRSSTMGGQILSDEPMETDLVNSRCILSRSQPVNVPSQ